MNDYKTCDICSGFNHETLVEKIKKIDSTAKIEIGCQNMCAIGATKPFVILNGMLLFDENEDNLILKIKDIIKQ